MKQILGQTIMAPPMNYCLHDCLHFADRFHDLEYSTYSYEPELFPGLIYRMVKPKIVLLIFVSGKVVLTG